MNRKEAHRLSSRVNGCGSKRQKSKALRHVHGKGARLTYQQRLQRAGSPKATASR